MMFCAFRIQDLTQYSADSGQPGNGAEWCAPVAPEPSARPPPGSSGQSHEAGPEFISTPLTPPRPAPKGSALGPRLRHDRRLLLPPLVPCHGASSALSPRLSSLHLPFSPTVGVSVFGRCSLPCASFCLGLGFLAPAPRPLPRPLQSRQLGPGAPRSHWPVRSPPPPRPGPPPGPSIHTKFGSRVAEGGGGSARPSSAPGRPDPGPGPRTSPYLIPAPGLRVPAVPVAQLRSSLLPARPSVGLSRCPSEGPPHPGPKVRPWP